MGNHANNKILWGTNVFKQNLSEKPLFSGLGVGGCVNFVCRGEEIGNFADFDIFEIFKIFKISPKWSWSHDHFGQPAKTCPIHDPRWGKKWEFCEIIENTGQ